MEADFDVGLVGADARAGQRLLAGVVDIVDHRAVELLRHRAHHHRGEQPVDGLRLWLRHLLDREPVDHREAHPLLQDTPRLGHRRMAMGHVEIGRAAQDRRQRMGAHLVDDAADFVEARGVERNAVVLGANIGGAPGAGAFDRVVEHAKPRSL